MIYTATGTINATNCGNVLMHEHIGCISNDMLHIFKQKWLDKAKLADFAVEILGLLKTNYDVGLIVDGTPIDLGRDVLLIKEVSERSNIPIVVSTGLYHYPSMYTSGHTETEIAFWFIDEFENGMEGTDIKPGILKAASDFGGITPDNQKRLSAMAIVQKETNLPIYVHSAHTSNLVEKQLEILLKIIRNPEKIIIGHAALNPNIEHLEKILSKGCYICMDQCHCTTYSIDSIGKAIAALCRRGYTDKILFSNDLCIYSDFGTRKNTGLHLSANQQADNFGYIFKVVHNSFLENGGNEKDWYKMFAKNAIDILNI